MSRAIVLNLLKYHFSRTLDRIGAIISEINLYLYTDQKCNMAFNCFFLMTLLVYLQLIMVGVFYHAKNARQSTATLQHSAIACSGVHLVKHMSPVSFSHAIYIICPIYIQTYLSINPYIFIHTYMRVYIYR